MATGSYCFISTFTSAVIVFYNFLEPFSTLSEHFFVTIFPFLNGFKIHTICQINLIDDFINLMTKVLASSKLHAIEVNYTKGR